MENTGRGETGGKTKTTFTSAQRSQSAVPQTMWIMEHKLPLMNDTDDVLAFITQLEIALKSSNLPQDKWKHHLLTQLTVSAKEPVVNLLDDELVGYEEVKQAILGRRVLSHAAAAEAFFTHNNKELLTLPVMQVLTKLKKWLGKMEEGAETEEVKKERVAMGSLKSQIVPEFKTFLD